MDNESSAMKWVENSVYPGIHWILYSHRHDYIARIDRHPCYGNRYRWVVYPFSDDRRVYGYADTLDEAKKMVENIMAIRNNVWK